jgi:hypothetical protein
MGLHGAAGAAVVKMPWMHDERDYWVVDADTNGWRLKEMGRCGVPTWINGVRFGPTGINGV